MAKTTTTNSAAIGITDAVITVASATGFAAGGFVKVNAECMQIQKGYVSGLAIPVMRGIEGTPALAHAVTSNVTVGLASDFVPTGGAPGEAVNYPLIRSRQIATYNAAGAIAHPVAGNDAVAIINGTTARALTLAAPAKDQDGDVLTVIGNGKAAHTITVAGGLGAASTGYTVATFIVGSQQSLQVMACNGAWVPLPGAMSGTLTNLLVALA